MTQPIIEAYIGEYASGKSENAVNRAIELTRQGRQVTLVDLDTVEPCYTLRPIKRELEKMGMTVVAWETAETVGLGEAGSVIKGEMRWVLRRSGDIIMDIGYGVHGAKIFNLIEGAHDNPYLKILAVVSAARPMTANADLIVEYLQSIGRVDGIINNTHLGDETDVEVIQDGARVISEAARKIGIPVVATTVVEELAKVIGAYDCMGHPVRPLFRLMPKTLW